MAPNACSRIGRVSLSKSNLVDRHQRHRSGTVIVLVTPTVIAIPEMSVPGT